MAIKTLVHISDLNLGRSADAKRGAIALRDALLDANVDDVVVTGDLTHRGRASELECFRRIFSPLQPRTRITLVPGNQDRLGDDVAASIQPGPRVSVAHGQGNDRYIVRFDSTGPHNRPGTGVQGILSGPDVNAIMDAIVCAPAESLVVLMMHHHILSLLPEHAPERLLACLGRTYQEDLGRGRDLLDALRGRCDLVLHGHGHGHAAQVATPFPGDSRSLLVFNAGNSTELGRARVFLHDKGRVLGPPAWLRIGKPTVTSETAPPRSRGLSAALRVLFAA